MELIHPASKADVVEALRDAGSDGRRILAVGGRQHVDKGNPIEVDAELWTTQLDRVVAYEPAEMVAVVEAGVRVRDLRSLLSGSDQEWPCDAPDEATVGGVIASGAVSPRRLRLGSLRDTVLEVELVTGDGRLVKGGGRTVKNVTGYDVPRLAAGSLGTLAVIVQVALKLRPLPKARWTIRASGDGLSLGSTLLGEVPLATAVLASAGEVQVRLEGWPEEVAAQTEAARTVLESRGATDVKLDDDREFPAASPWLGAESLVEAAVPPSRVPDVARACPGPWGAAVGTGVVWVGLRSDELPGFRERVATLGGVAPVIRGPGGLGDCSLPAVEVQRRLKAAFDPSGILAPGRFWGGI